MAEEKTESIVSEAKERFKRAEEAYSDSRQQAIADTKFAMGDSDNGWQWPDAMRESRENDKRVCLTVNLTAQHCNQIINQIRQNRPSCRVLPVDNFADKKTAEILSGLIRNIQTASAADDAHDLAAEHSVYGGEGYWRIVTEYESDKSFDQVIKIRVCPNPQLIYIDPDAKELDKSDAEWGFIFEDVNKETFKREHPEVKDTANWEISGDKWVTDETFLRSEYFYCEYVPDTALLLEDGSTTLQSELPDGVELKGDKVIHVSSGQSMAVIKQRKTQKKQWKWCKLVGNNPDPIDTKNWAGQYLPIISIVGKEINIDGEIIRKGIVRDLKDPARMVNYSYSETVQTLALQNKTPYMAAAEAIEGYEDEWATANQSNLAYLPYNAYDEQGKTLPVPQRQNPAVMPSAQVQLLQLSTEEMRGASGQQNSNFGIKSEASSGIGIQRLKQQGEIATFHFPDNLARGLRYEAKVLIDLIQKVYDTKRIVRVLGLDGQQQQATLDPEHPQPYSENDIGEEDIQKIFNPTLGQYDVVIDTGPSFQTQRQEAFASLSDLASRDPNLMQIAGDIIMRAADFPMAQELADRLQKTLPPQLQDQKSGADQQLAQVTSHANQMAQQIQMMTQQLQDTQVKLQQAESGQAKVQLEIEARKQMAELQASLDEQRMAREYDLKNHQALLEDQFKRELADRDAALSLEKAHQEASLALEKARMDNDTKKEITEMQVWGQLEVANIKVPALDTEVNKDLTLGESGGS